MKTSWVNGSQEDQKTVRERLKTAHCSTGAVSTRSAKHLQHVAI
jgi:hypothetical protein